MSLSLPVVNGDIQTTSGSTPTSPSGLLLIRTACLTSMANLLNSKHRLLFTTQLTLLAACPMVALAHSSLYNMVDIPLLSLLVTPDLLPSRCRVWFLDSH